jgi:hypothetical protein
MDGVADAVLKAGVDKRVKVGKVWLSLSKWHAKEVVEEVVETNKNDKSDDGEGLDEATPDYHVKYAKTKKGPWKVTKFMTLDQAKEFLADVRKDGMNGMISVDGKPVKEEVELDEAPKYELYHKDFSTAMQYAYKMAKKLHGITVKPSEIDDKVASGPRKPSEGKTNSYRLEGDKGAIQVQVYNKGGSKPYELNFYKEDVELDEALKVGSKINLPKGIGFWDTTNYPIGGKFGRVTDAKGLQITVSRVFKPSGQTKMSDTEGETKDGRKIAFKSGLVEEVEFDEEKKVGDTVTVKGKKGEIVHITKGKLKGKIAFVKFPGSKFTPDQIPLADLNEAKKQGLKLKCQECGKVFTKKIGPRTVEVKCPKCGSLDVDVAEEVELDELIKDPKALADLMKKWDKIGLKDPFNLEPKKGTILVANPKTQKVIRVGEKEWSNYEKKGWVQAEEVELDEYWEIGTDEYRDHCEKVTPGEGLKEKDVDPADVDDDATDDDRAAASKNIIHQLRKSIDQKGKFAVTFDDNKKVKVDAKIAQAVNDKFMAIKKPTDKEKFQSKIANSYKDMLKVLKNDYNHEETILDRIDRKLRERKNG